MNNNRMILNKIIKIGLLLGLLVLIACNKSKELRGINGIVGETSYSISEPTMDAEILYEDDIERDKKEAIQQRIIKTSYLTFETESVDAMFKNIQSQVKKHKGFIQNDETSKSYNTIRRSLVIRIPTQNFQPVIDSIANTVKTFDNKKISLQDVTEEFVDLEARLKAKKALETRYLQLLGKAKNVKEMLEIEREVAKIREEIEAKQGRLKYLTNKVSLSTIHVEFYEYTSVVKPKSRTYISQVVKALKGGFSSLGNFVLGMLYIWPFLIIIGILGYYIRKRIKKRRKK